MSHWIVHTTDSLNNTESISNKTSLLMSESLNRSFNDSLNNTESISNETSLLMSESLNRSFKDSLNNTKSFRKETRVFMSESINYSFIWFDLTTLNQSVTKQVPIEVYHCIIHCIIIQLILSITPNHSEMKQVLWVSHWIIHSTNSLWIIQKWNKCLYEWVIKSFIQLNHSKTCSAPVSFGTIFVSGTKTDNNL